MVTVAQYTTSFFQVDRGPLVQFFFPIFPVFLCFLKRRLKQIKRTTETNSLPLKHDGIGIMTMIHFLFTHGPFHIQSDPFFISLGSFSG